MQYRSAESQHAGDGVRAVLAAFLVVLLKWPDRRLPLDHIHGFQVFGTLPSTDVFRPLPPSEETPQQLEDLLGKPAVQYTQQLMDDAKLHPHAQQMAEKTDQEMQAGLCSGYRDKRWFDDLYGEGQWRGIP